MPQRSKEDLLQRIHELEQEVVEREKDISVFREELSAANKKLEALISELNRELKVLFTLQRHLIPTELPNVPGFEFSMKFVPSFHRGGDYFDVFEHQDKSRFSLIVASCTGHIMSSLLLSVLLKLTGRLEARKNQEAHKMLQTIAEELLPTIEGSDKAHLFYGIFDRRNYQMSYCKAGQIQALFYESSSQETKLVEATSGPLEKGLKPQFESKVLSFNSRDKLIVCTPGLAESKNLDGHEFGQDGLYKVVLENINKPVHELRTNILFNVHQFTSGQEPQADQTIVVAEVKDRVIRLAKK